MSSKSTEYQQGEPFNTPSSFIQLGSTLWLDLEGGVVIRAQQSILLTAREVHVLRILVQAMGNTRSHLSAHTIAQQIHLTDVSDPEHCIEQTISTVRHKLGEVAHHPQILRGRRGLGYRLFPEISSIQNSSNDLNKS